MTTEIDERALLPEIDANGLAKATSAVDAALEDHGEFACEAIAHAAITAYLAAPRTSEAAEPVAIRDETAAEHLARDIREGRFPSRSEPQKVLDVPDAWDRIAADPELARARVKLSMHELRLIIKHVDAARITKAPPHPSPVSEEMVERLERAIKDYDEAVEWHAYVPNDVNREAAQHKAAARLADVARAALSAMWRVKR